MKPRIPPPIIWLLSGILMWVMHQRMPLGRWIARPWDWLAFLPAAAGIYAITRNPMYLGLTLLLMAWARWLGTVSPWIMVLPFPIVITIFQIPLEERALEALFGDAYRDYRKRVARWVGVL